MTGKPATIGDTIARSAGRPCCFDWRTETEIVADVCAALGIDPFAPLANLVVLQPGQHVVEYRLPDLNDRFLAAGSIRTWRYPSDPSSGHAWVVVRSAVQEVTP